MASTRDLIERVQRQLQEAEAAGLYLPNAMALATNTDDGAPGLRTVLLKHVDDDGFVFYTNTRSRKGRELASDPRASLLFWWGQREQQIRVDGATAPVGNDEADEYFATRPRGSQLGAWASDQSAPLESHAHLVERYERLRSEYEGSEVPRPPHWSGYRLTPERIEFWYGKADRLHDRFEYTRNGNEWTERRLYP